MVIGKLLNQSITKNQQVIENLEMRFEIGELICLLTDQESSLPVCHCEDRRFYVCHRNLDRWKNTKLFCDIPVKEPVFGYVCGYDSPEVLVYAGAEFNEQVNSYLFAMLVVNKEPCLVRINELDRMLYRVIGSDMLEDKNGTRAKLLLNL